MNSAALLPGKARPFISLNDVSLRLHDRLLFEGLCWEMLTDQHWAVIGPNGSGKSVLMRALCGSLPVVKGNLVYHFLQDGGQTAAPQDHIAYVTFEAQRVVLGDEAFYQARWNMGVNQDTVSVSEFLSEHGVKSIHPYCVVQSHSDGKFTAQRQAVIEHLELGTLLARQVIQLSNGERRKVLIARALLESPRLLILDNPFAGLDERFRVRLAENLDELMQSDMRVVIVGTDRDAIPSRVTHVLYVESNRVIAQGPRQAVLNSCAAQVTDKLASLPLVDARRLSERRSLAPCGRENDGHEALYYRDLRQPARSLSERRSLAPCGRENDGHKALCYGVLRQAASQKNEKRQPPRKALVRMENVSVSYNGTQVLERVNWTVQEGERWALLGPNGAGITQSDPGR